MFSFKLFEGKDKNLKKNVKVNVNLANGASSGSSNKKHTNNFDRLKGNFGKHKQQLQRLSQYNSSDQPISLDTISKMETVPKEQSFVNNYYGLLGSYNDHKKRNSKWFKDFERDGQINMLRRVASLGAVDDILTKLVTEIIIPTGDEKYFAEYSIDRTELEAIGVKKEYIDRIESIADDFLPKIYRQLGFRLNGAKKALHNYFIEGEKAYELVYDDPENPKTLIQAIEINPKHLRKIYIHGRVYWEYRFQGDTNYQAQITQYYNNAQLGEKFAKGYRILYDWQVNYISWQDDSVSDHISYVHSIMKEANILRIMEETMLVWYVTTSSYRTVHKVPTQGMMATYAAQAVVKEKQRYSTDIEYDSTSGELYINDSPNIPFERTTFVADGEYGQPSIEVLNDRGQPLDDPKSVEYFEKKLYRTSKMPQSRFDQTGGDWSIDPTRAQRDEVYFSGFADTIKNNFAPILLKPLHLLIGFMIPELNSDDAIFDCIGLKWNSINQFKKLLDLAVMVEELSYIEKISDSMKITDLEGNEIELLPKKFLLQKHLNYTEEDIKQAEEMSLEEMERLVDMMLKRNQLLKDKGLDPEEFEGGGGGGGRRRF